MSSATLTLLCVARAADAQEPPIDPAITFLGTGYGSQPDDNYPAPGSVVNFYFTGIPPQPFIPSVTADPWPTELGGFAINIVTRNSATRVPLLSVRQVEARCGSGSGGTVVIHPACVRTVFAGQIPFDIPSSINPFPPLSRIVNIFVSARAYRSPAFALGLGDASVHILSQCDSNGPTLDDRYARPSCLTTLVGLPAGRLDARPGDVVTLYLWGLGSVDGATEGHANFGPGATRLRYQIVAEYGNATSPTWEGTPAVFWEPDDGRRTRIDPQYVGLVPGQVGLYQINFRIPDPPPNLRPGLACNLAVVVVADSQFATVDGATLCVDIPRTL